MKKILIVDGESATSRAIAAVSKQYGCNVVEVPDRQADLASEKESLYQEIVQYLGEGIVFTNDNNQFTFANPEAEKIFGVWSGQLVGKRMEDFLSQENLDIFLKQLQLRRSLKKSNYEIEINAADGQCRRLLISGTPRVDGTGKFVGTIAVIHDISRRKQIEGALRESQRLQKAMLDNIPDPAWLKNKDGRYLMANKSLALIYRRSIGEIIGRTIHEVFPEHAAKLSEGDKEICRSRKAVRTENHIPDAQGNERWFDTIETPVFDEQHEFAGTVGIARDITLHKQLELALRREKAFLEALVSSSPDGILVVGGLGRKMVQNNQFNELLKIPPDIAKDPDDIVQLQYVTSATSRPDQFYDKIQYLSSHPDETSEDEIEFKDGRILDRISAPVKDQEGKYYGRVWSFRDITERKQAEKQLHLQISALQAAANAIVITDRSGNIVFTNEAFNSLTGYTLEEVRGKNPRFLKSGAHDEDFYKQLWGTVTAGLVWRGEMVNRRKDGSLYHEEMTITPVRADGGNITHFIAIKQDITKRKQAEEVLHETAKKETKRETGKIVKELAVILLLGAMYVGFMAHTNWLQAPAENFAANHRTHLDDVFNVTCALFAGFSFFAYRQWKAIKKQVKRQMDAEKALRSLHAELETRVEQRTAELTKSNKSLTEEIAGRKSSEQELARERDLLKALMNNQPDFIYFKDSQSRFIRINVAHARHLGLRSPEEAVGKRDSDFHSADFARQTLADEQRIIATGEPILGQVEEAGTGVEKVWVSTTKVLLRDAEGRISGLVGISRNMTDSKRSEEALRAQKESFSALADNVPDAVARVDRELRIVYGNRALAKDIGLEAAIFLGKTGAELGLPADDLWHAKLKEAFQTGRTQRFEFQITGSEGIGYRETRLVPEKSADGKIEFVLAVTRDMTEQKRVEKERQEMELQLRQGQKLEAIGQLAAGIAHEINTPTQYVGDNTRFLHDAFKDIEGVLRSHMQLIEAAKNNAVTPELLARVEEVLATSDAEYLFSQIPPAIAETLEGVDRVTKIVRAMKEFSHPGGREKTSADLNKAIETTATVTRNEWKYVSDLKLELAADLPFVPCFIGEFNQCILNLIINAVHAISDVVKKNPGSKGLITISTRLDDKYVEVRVSDTGTGIAEIHRPHIFELFFTTKDVGRGTGQGLALVYTNIVKHHGGSVNFETEVGKGTTFIIRLPVVPTAVPGETKAGKPEAVS